MPATPARPAASLTDVVPRRTIVVVALVVALAVGALVVALALRGGDEGGMSRGGTKGGDKAASGGATAGSGGKDEQDEKEEKDGKDTASGATDADSTGGGQGKNEGKGQKPGQGSSTGSGSDKDDSGSDGGAATTYKHRQGFTIGLPKGWKYVSTDAAGARFTGPNGQKVLIGWTSTPKDDPVNDWKNQERYMTRSQYDRIRIESVGFRGWKAADWEFTYVDGGTKYRSIDRGFVVNSQQGYGMMYTAKAATWGDAERRETWRTFTRTFEPKS